MGIEISKSLRDSIAFHPQTVRDFIVCFTRYRYVPVADLNGLAAYFENVKHTKAASALKLFPKSSNECDPDPSLEVAPTVLWKIYSIDSMLVFL